MIHKTKEQGMEDKDIAQLMVALVLMIVMLVCGFAIGEVTVKESISKEQVIYIQDQGYLCREYSPQ